MQSGSVIILSSLSVTELSTHGGAKNPSRRRCCSRLGSLTNIDFASTESRTGISVYETCPPGLLRFISGCLVDHSNLSASHWVINPSVIFLPHFYRYNSCNANRETTCICIYSHSRWWRVKSGQTYRLKVRETAGSQASMTKVSPFLDIRTHYCQHRLP